MRILPKTVSRRLPMFRGLLDQRNAMPSGRDKDPAAATSPEPKSGTTLDHPEHSNTATREDIYYCFRLLLGRNPNPEEWEGHSSRAGEDLENVVSSYVTSREFAERGLLTKTYHENVELVRLPRFSVFASREDLAVGDHVLHGHPYDPGIAAVLGRYVESGMSVVDVGANIGCLTMLLASLVEASGRVVAIEPNPENIKLLEASRRINGFDQVIVIQAAAGRQTGLLALNVSHSNGMTGELPRNLDAVFATRPVPCFALDAILPKDRRIDLIKIDIEGAELNSLIGLAETLARDKPMIISEFSPGMLPGISHCSGPEYLRYLIANGYRIGVIEKDGSESDFGDDVDGVMGAYVRSGIDHVDLIATAR